MTCQAEYIADLENRLYWYQRALDIEPPTATDPEDSEPHQFASHSEEDIAEVDSAEDPPAPPDEEVETPPKDDASDSPSPADTWCPNSPEGQQKPIATLSALRTPLTRKRILTVKTNPRRPRR
jgi:hypothetical protein